MKNESLYNTFCQGAERVSHFGSRIDLSSLPLVKKNKTKVNKKVKSRTVSQVNKCRVVCLSVCLAIKTPHTPVDLYKEQGSSFSCLFVFCLSFFFPPISVKIKNNIQSTTINPTNTKYKHGLSSRRCCSKHWRTIFVFLKKAFFFFFFFL